MTVSLRFIREEKAAWFAKATPPVRRDLLRAGAAAAGGAAAAAATAAHGIGGFHRETHVRHVNGEIAGLDVQILVDAERVARSVENFVVAARSVEGKREARAAATAGSKIYADGGFFLIRKELIQLFHGTFTDGNHYGSSWETDGDAAYPDMRAAFPIMNGTIQELSPAGRVVNEEVTACEETAFVFKG
jgi:hypothetical protein